MARNKNSELKACLNTRHIKLIALGSAIGTGLFYGSAEAIHLAGPAIILAYVIGGLSIFMVMRCLGEMSIHNPASHSFSHYATQYISPWLGFTTGWMFIFEMIVVCLADITAFGLYMQFWFPNIAQWQFILGLVFIIGGLNLCTVRLFGEMEFWLSLIKITAIAGMIVCGVIIMFFYSDPNNTMGVSNLWKYDGFFPKGIGGLIAAFTIVMYSFGGMEIIGITAAETKDIKKSIPDAINSIPIRVLLFYVLTLTVLMCLYPWNKVGLDSSPFVSIFQMIGIKSAANILNIVVIIAAISAINGDIYSATRMMYGLSKKGQATKSISKLNKCGVPYIAVIIIVCILLIGVILNYYIPTKIFAIIAAMATFSTLWVWLTIALSHFMFRRSLSKDEQKNIFFKAPFWPYGQILNILFLVFVMASLLFNYETIIAFFVCVIWTCIVLVIYNVTTHKKAKKHTDIETIPK